jgi:hypothetical protein
MDAFQLSTSQWSMNGLMPALSSSRHAHVYWKESYSHVDRLQRAA